MPHRQKRQVWNRAIVAEIVQIESRLLKNWRDGSGLPSCRKRAAAHRCVEECSNERQEFVCKLFNDPRWNWVEFTGFACCTANEASYHGGINNLELVETGGAWRFIKNRGCSRHSRWTHAASFEKASAVSSSEFGGFSFFCRRTDFRCCHNFFGSPLLSVIFLSQNSLCFRPYNRCFFWACVVQANRSLTKPSPSIMLFKRSCPTLGCGAIRVKPKCCGLMAMAYCTTGSVLVEESAESGVVHLLKVVNWGAIIFRRIAQIGSLELAPKPVLVETLPGPCADIHKAHWRMWEL